LKASHKHVAPIQPTYRNALNDFLRVINVNHINPDERLPSELPEEAIAWFALDLKENLLLLNDST
jgi:hypothetical protein